MSKMPNFVHILYFGMYQRMLFHDSSNLTYVSDSINECHSLFNHPLTVLLDMYSKDAWII